MGIFDDKPGGIFGNNPDGGILNRKKKDDDDADFSDAGSDSSSTASRTGGAADFSDVSEGSSSEAPGVDSGGGGQSYTVKSGDSLSKIAKHFYGDGSKWNRIFEANRDKISNPDLIHPGQEFTIPDA
ncbi:MAG: LysM peptidoglycan-binding domain-containing protein [Gemmatimonadota bacterium]|nr:LysM peptidoglycan-binding domain-containing protein [Gemmatimonadota bacterium]